MTQVFMGLMVFLFLGMILCCIMTICKKGEYTRVILRLLIVAILSMLCYSAFRLAENRAVAMLFNGLYYAGTDWMLLCLLGYVVRYSGIAIRVKLYRNLFYTCTWVDTLSMIVNVQNEHVFSLERVVQEGTGITYWSVQFHNVEYIHLAFCYLLTAIIFVILIMKLLRVAKIYRKMYLSTLLTLLLVVILNAICYLKDSPFDYSVLVYTLFAISICYYSIFAVPKGLLEGLLMTVVQDSNQGLACYDINGKCVYANTMIYELFKDQYSNTNAVLERLYRNWKTENPRNVKDYEQWEETVQKGDQELNFHGEYQRLRDEQGIEIGCAFRVTNRTDELKAIRSQQYKATHDQLTGLYNKEYFYQKAEEILKRKPNVDRYMVCTYIKDLKLLTELFGEETGDQLLVDQAALLQFANYEDCIQGRIDSDHFAMLISRENFRSDLAEASTGKLQYLINDSNYSVKVMIGVYLITDPNEAPDVMFKKARKAIEQDDGDFHKNVVFYDGKMMEQLVREKSIISEFEHALQEKEFKMYLQPIVGDDGKVKGAEALTRWQHPSQGLLLPYNFISVVEKSGMIIKLDEYMWEMAAQKLNEWKQNGNENMTISVNVSTRDFYYTNLYEFFVGLTQKYDFAPKNMKLEVKEDVLVADFDSHMKTVHKLREYGFYIDIDGFGGGHSSLEFFKDIKADGLKISTSFVREMETNEANRIILNHIISMARELGLSVVTEGVETYEQLESLKAMGCKNFQGYYFSKPISVEEFEGKYMV